MCEVCVGCVFNSCSSTRQRIGRSFGTDLWASPSFGSSGVRGSEHGGSSLRQEPWEQQLSNVQTKLRQHQESHGKNPASDDLLKRRCAGAAQCRPCFSFMERDDRFQNMSQSQRVTFLEDDGNYEQFMADLSQWEGSRRDGSIRGKAKSKEGGDRAEALQSSSITTKQVLGYFWPLQLLKEHEKPVRKRSQQIIHQGRKVKGMTLKEFAVGCIEITSESSKTARRVHVVANDSEESGDADEMFGAMQKSLQMRESLGRSCSNRRKLTAMTSSPPSCGGRMSSEALGR